MNESMLIKKMREKYLFFVSVSIVYALLFTVFFFENTGGLSFFFFSVMTVIISYAVLRRMDIEAGKKLIFPFICIILAGLNSAVRARGFFQFFNWIVVLFLWGHGMISQVNDEKEWKFFDYIRNYFVFIASGIASVFSPFTHWLYMRRTNRINGETGTDKTKSIVLSVIGGLVISFFFLLVVMPLLMSSDRVFSKMFSSVTSVFYSDRIVAAVFLIVFGFFFCYAFFAALFKQNVKCMKEDRKRAGYISGMTFLTIISIIYVIYSMIQIIYLFMSGMFSLPEGVTYSEYARAGFWQLVFVAVINLMTVMIYDMIFERKRQSDAALFLISICTFIMMGSAAYRMAMYIETYQLTFLRVFVLWFLFVLALVFAGVLIYIIKRQFPVFRYMTVVVVLCYIIFSYVNVDSLIVSYNMEHAKESAEGVPDLNYMAYNLSEDGAKTLMSYDLSKYFDDPLQYKDMIREYKDRIAGRKLTLRGWNYGISQAKKAVKEH